MAEPRTPERDRASQREQDRVNRLQMSSPDERRRSQRDRVLNPPFFPDLGNQPNNELENDFRYPVPFLAVPRSPPRVQYHYPAPWPYDMNVPALPAPPYQQQYAMLYNPNVNPYPPHQLFPNYPPYPLAPAWGNYVNPMQMPPVVGNINEYYPVPAQPLPNNLPVDHNPQQGFEFPPAPLEQLRWPPLPVLAPVFAGANEADRAHEPAYIPPNLADFPQSQPQPRALLQPLPQPLLHERAEPPVVNRRAEGQRRRRQNEAEMRQVRVQEAMQQLEIEAANANGDQDEREDDRNDQPEEDGWDEDLAAPAEPHALNARQLEKARRDRAIERLGRGRHSCGAMDKQCEHCAALHWVDERLSKSSVIRPKFGHCCKQGRVKVPLTLTPPRPLIDLWLNNHRHSTNFLTNIRKYNNAFAFTSFGFKSERRPDPPGRGPTTYVIAGECYHELRGMEPHSDAPTFAQLYVLDSAETAARHRSAHSANQRTKPELMMELSELLNEHHAYAQQFKHAYERLSANPAVNISLTIRQNRTLDPWRYNRPTAQEIAVVVLDSDPDRERDIQVYKRDGGSQHISSWNPAYGCLHYVLFFPFGEHGFQYGMPSQQAVWQPGARIRAADRVPDEQPLDDGDAQGGRKRKTISELEFYAFLFYPREKLTSEDPRPGPNDHFGTLFRGKGLFQQWLANTYVNIEESRLIWIKNNQNTLRADIYAGVRDAVLNDNLQLGQAVGRIILPSSFHGGARQMQEKYQDSMALARYLGPPQFFVTMTANPAWPEIRNELLPGQNANDRPDLTARVFELKKRAMLKLLKTEGALGKHRAHVYTIEFQKRGLPHMHLLLWTDKNAHVVQPSDVDEVISAEIPNEEEDPLLYHTVTTCMMHGPCGPDKKDQRCWDNERNLCKKGFWPLKPWKDHTVLVENSYPHYMRRDDGRFIIKMVDGREFCLDNRHVVPFCRYLSRFFDCHINVEMVTGIRGIKYIHKYVFKGNDRVSLELPVDEVARHREGRYISASEGAWHLAGNSMSASCPNIVRLQFHLEDEENIVFRDDMPLAQVMANRKDTMLTAFFKMNNSDDLATRAAANDLVYQEFPSRFVWLAKDRCWKLRVRSGPSGPGIGRMPYIPATVGEKYFLRMLLTVVKGCTSFQSLRTYEGTLHNSYQDCCLARGLLEDDGEWHTSLEEAALVKTGVQLRKLFAMILKLGTPAQPMVLWNTHKQHICDDLERKLRRLLPAERAISEEDIYDYGLYLVQQLVEDQGGNMVDLKMQTCVQNWANIVDAGNRLINDQLMLAEQQPEGIADQHRQQFNEEQSAAYERVYQSATAAEGQGFFLDGPAGTGKTFLYKGLCYQLRSEGFIVLCVASSGIAALLLPGGRTLHSMFKIPLKITERSTCNITKNTDLAQLIKRTKLIIWDEVPMQHKFCAEAFDRTTRDIMNAPDKPFGGITMVFGGDFCQTLPVVPHGEPEDVIAACLQRSHIWRGLETLRLTQNMRLQNNPEAAEFAQFLLNVGAGTTIQEGDTGPIRFPAHMLVQSESALFESIYPNLSEPGAATDEFLRSRTILTARNTNVIDLNTKLLAKFPGETKTYQSSDKVEIETGADHSDTAHYTVEYLNSLQSASIPLSQLELKVGVPVMVLRNLAASQGVCNGSRGVITHLGSRVLEMRLLSGTHAGQTVFIPRISIVTDESEFGFKLSRRQFPIRLAFVMTINKSQGQSVDSVGIHLETPVFSHGQLYVALSRCTSAARVRIFNNTDQSTTKNVVYKSVLTS